MTASDHVICPSCGIPNKTGNNRCSGCGLPLTAEKRRDEQSPIRMKKEKGPGQKNSKGRRNTAWSYFAAGIILGLMIGYLIGTRTISPVQQMQTAPAASDVPQVSPTLLADIESLQKTVDGNPLDTASVLQLANALHDVRFLPRAIEMYRKYLAQNPKNPDARVDLGICLFESGEIQPAINEMKKALTYNSRHQMALFNLGIIHLNQSDLSSALEWFKKSIASNPSTEIAHRAEQIVTQHSSLPLNQNK
jgi:tetratricopeptide (TPR) repeat protein